MYPREARAKFFPEEIARGYVLFRDGLVGVTVSSNYVYREFTSKDLNGCHRVGVT